MRAVHAAVAATLVVVAVLSLSSGTAQAQCRGEIAPESIATPSLDRQLLIGVRWSLDVMLGDPTRKLELAFRLPRLIEVPGHGQIGLASLTPEERAGLRPETYEVSLSFNRSGSVKCIIAMNQRTQGTMGESEGSWGWDVPAGMTWEAIMDGYACDAEEAKAVIKADCPNVRVWVKPDFTLYGIDAIKRRLDAEKAAERALQDAKLKVTLGRHGQAIALLERALAEHPGDRALQEALEDAREPLELIYAAGKSAETSGNLSYASQKYAEGLSLARGSSEYVELFETEKARVDRAIDAQAQSQGGGGGGAGGGSGGGSGGGGDDDDDDDSDTNTGPIMGPDILDPVYQLQLAQAQLHASSQELAAGLAAMRPGEQKALALMVGPPLLVYGLGLMASGLATDGFGKGQILGHSGTFVVPSALVLGIAGFANGGTRRIRTEESQRHIAAATERCDAGSLAHCVEATRLARDVHDLNRRAPDRSDSTRLWGPGARSGPAFAYYGTAGVSIGGISGDDDLDGSLVGFTTKVRARSSFARLGIGIESRFGSIDPTGEIDGVWSVSGAVGAQAGAGFLSPFVEARFGVSGAAGADPEATDSPALDDSVDAGITVGNTFHFHGLFSTRGPAYTSLVAEVSRTFSLSGALDDSWQLTAGFATYAPTRYRYYPDEVGRAVRPVRESSYTEPLFVYVLPVGIGVEILRSNGIRGSFWVRAATAHGTDHTVKRGPDGLLISVVDAYLRFANGEIDGGGASLFALGYRHRFQSGRWEAGFSAALVGGMVNEVSSDDQITVGMLPSRIFVRHLLPRVSVEAGVRSPLFWLRPETAANNNNATLYGGWPGFVYLGAGF